MEVSPARTYGGCMTSNFALQLSGSIWVTYDTFEILGWLEAWYLKNGLHIIGFISIAYYINFEAIAGRCGVAGGVNFGCFGISAPTCSCDKFCLIHLLHGAHPNVHVAMPNPHLILGLENCSQTSWRVKDSNPRPSGRIISCWAKCTFHQGVPICCRPYSL